MPLKKNLLITHTHAQNPNKDAPERPIDMQLGKNVVLCVSLSMLQWGSLKKINPIIADTVAVLMVCSQLCPSLWEGGALWTPHFICTVYLCHALFCPSLHSLCCFLVLLLSLFKT